MQRDDLLVWIDLEMTSVVDPAIDQIIQIGSIITDKNLEIIAEGPEITIGAPAELFENIPDDAQAAHDESGIIPKVLESTVTLAEGEQQTLSFLKEYVTPQSSPMCGNSVHMDRSFLFAQMRKLHDFFHYRNIDVSSIKELARRWRPELFEKASEMKKERHRAKDDILESIEELKFYRDNFFKF